MISQTFNCYKCTRCGIIFASTVEGCYRIAHSIGWRQATHGPGVLGIRDPERGVICCRCPGGNAKGNLSVAQAEQIEIALQKALRDKALLAEIEKEGLLVENMPPADLQDALVTLA